MATYSSARLGRGRSLRRGESRRPGQWKLAYADFLTALMAFFLLMWLSTERSIEDRQGIAAYFQGGAARQATLGEDASILPSLIETITSSTAVLPNGHRVLVSEIEAGVRVELIDAHALPLFDMGGEQLSEVGANLISHLASLIEDQPIVVTIEGHTDAFPASGSSTNWDLSADRANAARSELEGAGFDASRIKAVVGLADTVPLLPNQPHAAVNRRISIVLELGG
ncbi:MAG: flagellar motor protein MotB [Pseudomonadota bacterium]